MQKKNLAIIPCDGICEEIFPFIDKTLDFIAPQLNRFYFFVGLKQFETTGYSITDETIEGIKKCDAVLFGAVTTPTSNLKNYRSPVLTLRRELDVFVNVRPIKNILSTRNINLTIFRENTEGLYVQKEYFTDKDTAIAEKVVTRNKTERLAKFAYEYALKTNIKKMTIVQKSNVLKLSDRFFLDICKEISKDYPQIETTEEYIDAACYHLVREPLKYNGIIAENLYGDILSDLAAGLSDGLGLAYSSNIGEKYGFFEPVHGSAPDIMGKDIANPYAVLFSLVMLLEYIEYSDAAKKLYDVIISSIKSGLITKDMGGNYKMSEVMNIINSKLS